MSCLLPAALPKGPLLRSSYKLHFQERLGILQAQVKAPLILGNNGKSRGGGARGTRTPDPLHAMQVLSQLSYGPAVNGSRAATANVPRDCKRNSRGQGCQRPTRSQTIGATEGRDACHTPSATAVQKEDPCPTVGP